MMLMVPGVYTGYVVALAWISNSLPRPPAKRAAALAFINAISNTSSIYASYMYSDSASRFFSSCSHSFYSLERERKKDELIWFADTNGNRAKIRSSNGSQLRDGIHGYAFCSHSTYDPHETQQEIGSGYLCGGSH